MGRSESRRLPIHREGSQGRGRRRKDRARVKATHPGTRQIRSDREQQAPQGRLKKSRWPPGGCSLVRARLPPEALHPPRPRPRLRLGELPLCLARTHEAAGGRSTRSLRGTWRRCRIRNGLVQDRPPAIPRTGAQSTRRRRRPARTLDWLLPVAAQDHRQGGHERTPTTPESPLNHSAGRRPRL